MLCLITIDIAPTVTQKGVDVNTVLTVILTSTMTQADVDVNTVLTVILTSTVTQMWMLTLSYNDNSCSTVTQTDVGAYNYHSCSTSDRQMWILTLF